MRNPQMGAMYLQGNRNKRSIVLNLRHDAAKDALLRMIARADVFIENYRPGTFERWGLGYEALAKINPRLVMVRVSGWGQDGPYRDRPGFGTMVEAMSGFAATTGPARDPRPTSSMPAIRRNPARRSSRSCRMWASRGGDAGRFARRAGDWNRLPATGSAAGSALAQGG